MIYWGIILSIAWFMGEDATKTEGGGDSGPIAYWVEWRVCHNNTFISYLLAYCLLFPRALVIGYNIIAMYKNMFTLFLASNIAFVVNYLLASTLSGSIQSNRPGWPFNPQQTCDSSHAVPDPTMVSTLSFIFQVAIMKHSCGVGVSRKFILHVILFATLYVVANIVNNYMHLWQVLISISLALALSVAWAFATDSIISEFGKGLTGLRTWKLFGFEDDYTL